MSDETILVGKIGAAHGIRGEVRVKSFTSPLEAIADYGPLRLADGKTLTVDRMRDQGGGMLVVKFHEIADRTAAEKLTNRDLTILRSALPEPEDEETFYHADLVGLEVVDGAGTVIGVIVAVPDYGAGDLLEIRPAEGNTFYLPFTKAFVPVVDLVAKKVVAELPEGFFAEAKPEADEDGADLSASDGVPSDEDRGA